jgi:hypothetical protein
MNREIKFKYYFQHEETGRMCSMIFDYAQIFNGDCKRICDAMTGYVIIGKEQFVGLKDKKGVEIYEGDVCKIADPYEENEKTFTVEYSNGGFAVEWHSMFCGGEADMTTIGWAIDSEFSIEVIGNIYQNPDLLQ